MQLKNILLSFSKDVASDFFNNTINMEMVMHVACGVCHSDLHVMKGELPFSSPCVIGHEITGEVVEHGAHTDNGVKQRYMHISLFIFLYM